LGKILRFHPLSSNKEDERMLSIKGIDMTISQFREEVVKQEIQRELDRRCTGCPQYNDCEQAGTEIKYDGKKLLIMRESDILAIL